ncbi:hypothetical protein C8F04DRAFT_1188025 [Mycena alexandri]|uniref:Uncharacterized protein n=1 Tax=Mycena alexandri TaxID=1745969 RepID=A0AAD6SMN4_9AGAR|nr:hypothetical protein C8F04DRAFT_1188025 [Mycena alexandri]
MLSDGSNGRLPTYSSGEKNIDDDEILFARGKKRMSENLKTRVKGPKATYPIPHLPHPYPQHIPYLAIASALSYAPPKKKAYQPGRNGVPQHLVDICGRILKSASKPRLRSLEEKLLTRRRSRPNEYRQGSCVPAQDPSADSMQRRRPNRGMVERKEGEGGEGEDGDERAWDKGVGTDERTYICPVYSHAAGKSSITDGSGCPCMTTAQTRVKPRPGESGQVLQTSREVLSGSEGGGRADDARMQL